MRDVISYSRNVDKFIDFKRNQRNLVEEERSWIFEKRNPFRFLGKQPNLVVSQNRIYV
jgi:hypothetical protein